MHFPRRDIAIGVRAKGSHVPCADVSPVGEDRRKNGSGFSRSELQKSMARTALEGAKEALSNLRIEGRRVRIFDYGQAAVRR